MQMGMKSLSGFLGGEVLGDDGRRTAHVASITLKASELHHMLRLIFLLLFVSPGTAVNGCASHAGEAGPGGRGRGR